MKAGGQLWACRYCPSESGRSNAEAVTASGRIQADTYVIAAGLGTPDLARKAGIEVLLAHKPSTLNVYTVPAPPLLRHMLLSG
jgi:glycine/D-amino acid oxidase-like deaminating enzyme